MSQWWQQVFMGMFIHVHTRRGHKQVASYNVIQKSLNKNIPDAMSLFLKPADPFRKLAARVTKRRRFQRGS
jgi:hypothetical protein